MDITPDVPEHGGLLRRLDGPQPHLEWIGEWGNGLASRGVAWIRGITAIPDPEHTGKESILCSRQVDGIIEIINPQRNFGRFNSGLSTSPEEFGYTARIFKGTLPNVKKRETMKTIITLIGLSTILVCLATSAQTQQRPAGAGLE